MNLEQFQATRQRLALSEAPDYAQDYVTPDVTFAAVLVYQNGLIIFENSDGTYWLPLERDDYSDADLELLERKLYYWHREFAQ